MKRTRNDYKHYSCGRPIYLYLAIDARLMSLRDEVQRLKSKRNAIILVHNYQLPEVQDVADFIGDSLGLSQKAAKTDSDVIVFCGVDFMAESAKILSPDKTVLLPELGAVCPMAEMIDRVGIVKMKSQHPKAESVAYVNTSAETKAEVDICCTSSNAIKVVASLTSSEVIFVPDANLGYWVQRSEKNKKLILWPGFCPTHDSITTEMVLAQKGLHPSALVIAHPECRPEVLDMVDAVRSTEGMINFAKESESKEFIIATEKEMVYRLHKLLPDKTFYPLPGVVCPNMKKTNLQSVVNALEKMQHEITIPDDIIKRARLPLERMMAVGRGD
jgi:quinolinate synthase